MAKKREAEKKQEKFESLKDKAGPIKREKIDKAIELEGKKRIEIIKEREKKGFPVIYAALIVIVIAAIGGVLLLFAPSAVSGAPVKEGDTVQIAYTAKYQNGSVFDKGNFTFRIGADEAIEGVDEAIVGMRLGESKSITVPPEKAYGYPDPLKVMDIPLIQVLNKTEALTVEQFNLTFGFEPEVNETYQLEDMYWPLRVLSIENGTVRLRHEPQRELQYDLADTFGNIYGTATVTASEDNITIKTTPINGSEVATVVGMGRIISYNETHMKMDFNHQLAGQTLQFEIKVLNILHA
jgi:FKBP-type peptidyl-prolyl cis-trans isomerase 2